MNTHDILKKSTAALLVAALVLPQGIVFALPAQAAVPLAPVASFQGVEVSEDIVTIKLSTAVLYNSFLTSAPPRLVMEFLDTKQEGAGQSVPGKGKFLKGVRTSQFKKSPRMVTRIVFDLVKMAGYKVALDAKGLSVAFVGSVEEEAPKADAKAAEAAPAVPVATVVPIATAAAPPAASMPKIVAKRAVKSAAKPAAPPAESAALPDAVTLPAAVAVPVASEAPLAAVEPEKPALPKVKPNVSAAAAFKRSGFEGKMSPELVAVAESDDVSREKAVIPADVGDDVKSDRRLGGRIYKDIMGRLPKDNITLDFDNTDIRDIIKLLAAKAKINIIYGADVSGALTLRLGDVPFNEAFRTVLSMMQLSTDQVGENILRVITPAELTKQRTSATTITKVIPLNYAKASDVKATIDSVRTAEGRAGSSSIDAKTNSLIVTESLEGMLATENLVSQLDQRPRQVLIEAKLVEVNANSGLNYGIQWDYAGSEGGKMGGKQGTTLIGSLISPQAASSPMTRPIDLNVNAVVGGGASGRGTGVTLAADRIFGALTVGRITNNYFLSATLTAAASEGKAKVLSNPKIATLNNQPANINVTTQIPYVTSNVASTGVQTQTVNYATVGIKLTVTPSINADNRILLVINPSVSQPSVTAAGSTQTGAPAIDSRDANTTVLVRDGETIVIGGLINDTMQDTIAKIPLLGDIPVLGWLFKKKTKTRVRNELLIFVTTRMLAD
ncbi:MAG TPA: hypothetical protein DCZ01_04565 [Elusimicrobia bacterium]|nr:MAG: hypothetical protein A2X37_12235 [Elusimicrobia bacterium GWA2_66_18]HAZ07798.1 hypothetical protein [Elusimicrobiota bacterium]